MYDKQSSQKHRQLNKNPDYYIHPEQSLKIVDWALGICEPFTA